MQPSECLIPVVSNFALRHCLEISKMYLETSRISMMEVFAKIVNGYFRNKILSWMFDCHFFVTTMLRLFQATINFLVNSKSISVISFKCGFKGSDEPIQYCEYKFYKRFSYLVTIFNLRYVLCQMRDFIWLYILTVPVARFLNPNMRKNQFRCKQRTYRIINCNLCRRRWNSWPMGK